jgi:hypothetical protein
MEDKSLLSNLLKYDKGAERSTTASSVPRRTPPRTDYFFQAARMKMYCDCSV